MKIYRLISYQLELISYPILFLNILKNIAQHNGHQVVIRHIFPGLLTRTKHMRLVYSCLILSQGPVSSVVVLVWPFPFFCEDTLFQGGIDDFD